MIQIILIYAGAHINALCIIKQAVGDVHVEVLYYQAIKLLEGYKMESLGPDSAAFLHAQI